MSLGFPSERVSSRPSSRSVTVGRRSDRRGSLGSLSSTSTYRPGYGSSRPPTGASKTAVDPELLEVWKSFDADGSGAINFDELIIGLTEIVGFRPSEEAVKKILDEVDFDGSGSIEFNEFCHFFGKLEEINMFRQKREARVRTTVCLTACSITTSFGGFATLVMMDVTTPSSERDTSRYEAIKTGELIMGVLLAIFFFQAVLVPIIISKCKIMAYLAELRTVLFAKKPKTPGKTRCPPQVAKKLGQALQLKAFEKSLPVKRVWIKSDVAPVEVTVSSYRGPTAAEMDLPGHCPGLPAEETQPAIEAGQTSVITQSREVNANVAVQSTKLPGPGGCPPLLEPTKSAHPSDHRIPSDTRWSEGTRSHASAAGTRSHGSGVATRSNGSPVPSNHLSSRPVAPYQPLKPEKGRHIDIYSPDRYRWMHEVQDSYLQAPVGFHAIKQTATRQQGAYFLQTEDDEDNYSRAHANGVLISTGDRKTLDETVTPRFYPSDTEVSTAVAVRYPGYRRPSEVHHR